MRPLAKILRKSRFAREEKGAAILEFAIVLPLTLFILAMIFESGRVFWSYQVAISGVRDATRFIARVAPADTCPTTAGVLDGLVGDATTIISQRISSGGQSILPQRVTLTGVQASLTCISGTFRTPMVPVATLTADVRIELPFGRIFSLIGSSIDQIDTRIGDQARVYGL